MPALDETWKFTNLAPPPNVKNYKDPNKILGLLKHLKILPTLELHPKNSASTLVTFTCKYKEIKPCEVGLESAMK